MSTVHGAWLARAWRGWQSTDVGVSGECRVLKPGEERLASFYLRLQPDALLIRSAGMLQQMNALRAHGMPSS